MDANDLARIAALEMQTHGFLPAFGPDVWRELESTSSKRSEPSERSRRPFLSR